MEYQAEDQNEYAKDNKGEIKFILEVERGTKGFWCLGCHESMHPVRRTVEHYKSYFRHEAKDVSVERKCTFSSEKARRILAMDILGRTKRIKVPNLYKYSPDGQSKILIKDAEYIEATSVKGDITFYNDEAGLLKWGKNLDIEESTVLLKPDITFFDRVQMDFKDADSKGNFALKHYHENYGYDLESVLSKHPIKELGNNSHKDDLMNSLKKGNLQSATFIKDGQEVKQYIEATPQFKTLTVYDADMKRLDTRQAKEQGQSQGTGEGKSQDTKKQQSAMEEDGPGEKQEKKQRRKKQSL